MKQQFILKGKVLVAIQQLLPDYYKSSRIKRKKALTKGPFFSV